MRSLLAAVVTVVAVFFLVTVGHAEPPPPLEARPVSEVLEALERAKSDPSTLASVRWYLAVSHGKSIDAPVGSPKTTLGPWSDNNALLAAEQALGSCEPLKKEDSAAALALLERSGESLPALLRGMALREKGDLAGAVQAFAEEARVTLPPTPCPSEHPMYSHRRVARLTVMSRCLERWKAKDAATVKALLERAKSCAANNHSVG